MVRYIKEDKEEESPETYKLDKDIKNAIKDVRKAIFKLADTCRDYKLKDNDQVTALILSDCKDLVVRSLNKLDSIETMAGVIEEGDK